MIVAAEKRDAARAHESTLKDVVVVGGYDSNSRRNQLRCIVRSDVASAAAVSASLMPSTSSSAAVMPLSIKTAVDRLGVRPTTAQFVIPLGATINMNGTALYQAVAAVFLAQVYQVDISTGGLALIVAMAVGASIGSPATPGVGIVILAGILTSIGVPAGGVALIIGVDRLLDMSRTAVNAAGDLVACLFLDRWVLQEAPAETNPRRPNTDR